MKTFAQPFAAAAALAASALIAATAVGAEMEDAASMHMHHHMMMGGTTSQLVDYQLPEIRLVRDDGEKVVLADELNDGRPVVLNFIYTTCTTICPLASRTFAELQERLGNERDTVHMVSISIDPEQDTPAVLAKYASKFGAGKQWRFYTGTVAASVAAQRAFDAYRGNKMNHNPTTFIRTAPGKPWLRIEGFAKTDELLRGLRGLDTSTEARVQAID